VQKCAAVFFEMAPAIHSPRQCAIQAAEGGVGLDNRAKWLGSPIKMPLECLLRRVRLDSELQER
jgi:hypothetical protein